MLHCRLNPFLSSRCFWLRAMAVICALWLGNCAWAAAQAREPPLPSAPDATKRGDEAPQAKKPQESDPVLTMAPHPEGARYWLSGQANVIFQGRLPFHSAYEGPNSFRNSAEYKTSLLGTLYMAVRPWRSIRYQNDLILDIESSGGRGLSQALGLAGFTNLDVVRNPNLGSKPYLARYQIHQVIGLTDETVRPGGRPVLVGGQIAGAADRVPRGQDDAAGFL